MRFSFTSFTNIMTIFSIHTNNTGGNPFAALSGRLLTALFLEHPVIQGTVRFPEICENNKWNLSKVCIDITWNADKHQRIYTICKDRSAFGVYSPCGQCCFLIEHKRFISLPCGKILEVVQFFWKLEKILRTLLGPRSTVWKSMENKITIIKMQCSMECMSYNYIIAIICCISAPDLFILHNCKSF